MSSSRTVRGYELRESVGMGGFGAVYRAYQPVVDREVAIKIILPQYANEADFIRRFEAEAHLIARLEHPHIVPLYDYWREPGGAYLVMRWLRGGNLRRALKDGPWGLEQSVRLVDQIAAALMAAHRSGVVHSDVKPDNILLDEGGNAYLSDFGIARDMAPSIDPGSEKVVYGSLAYLAPERIKKVAALPASDQYSLGIVVYELLTGLRPFSRSSAGDIVEQQMYSPVPALHTQRPDLQAVVDTVIWRATAKEPAARYPDVLAFAADFRRLALQEQMPAGSPARLPIRSGDTGPLGGGVITVAFEPSNPYKGLRPFEEADTLDFFGRETLVKSLVQRLGETGEDARFLAVVGPSGSGKSSVVRAGVIPALRRGGLPASEDWFIVTLVPGAHPAQNLTSALLRVASSDFGLGPDFLDAGAEGLHRVVQAILPPDTRQLVLLIDQFEEVFTLVEGEDERVALLDNLFYAITAPNSRLRVIITLRADFYDRPLLYPGFGELMRRRTEVVLPLTPAELERAIAGPARRMSLSIEPGLAAALVADTSEQPGALPLLQYTLTELFDRRDGQRLTRKAYADIGGISGALAQRADELYQTLDAEGQRAVRQLFLRLVNPGDDEGVIRRRVTWPELTAGHDGRRYQRVLDLFGQHRLLIFDHEPVTRLPTVEIAHEALMREWGQLREWIDTSREALRTRRQLSAATTDWMQAGRDSSFLASGARLEQFEGLMRQGALSLSEQEIDYVQAGINQRRARLLRLRLFVVLLIGLTLASLGLALFAIDRQGRAVEQEHIARSRELALTALTSRQSPDLALLLSLEALNQANTFEARSSLLTSLQDASPVEAFLYGHTDWVRAVAFSPDGSALASGGRDNTVRLWDTTTHQPIGQPLVGHDDWVNSVAFSPDGTVLASGSSDGIVRLWDAATGETVGQPLSGHSDSVNSVAYSPDGTVLASGSSDGTVQRWDTMTGEGIGQSLGGHSDSVNSVAYSPDGTVLASGSSDGTVRLWDAVTGETIGQPLTGHTNWILGIAYSPDGTRLASSDVDGTIILWDVESGEALWQIATDHTDWIRSLVFSPDGAVLASGSADGTVRLWNATTGERVGEPLDGHYAAVWSVAFTQGRRLASGGADGRVILWKLDNDPPRLARLSGHREVISDVAFSPDGTLAASAGGDLSGRGADNTVRLWDVTAQTERAVLAGHAGPVLAIAFQPGGDLLASAGADRTVILWRVSTGEMVYPPLTGQGDVIWDIAFSPDGSTLATAGDDGRVLLWNATTGTKTAELTAEQAGGLVSVAFSVDGARLAAGGRDGSIMIWDTASRQPAGEPLTGHRDVVTALAYSPDGRILASVSRDLTIRLWDASTGAVLKTITGHQDWVSGLAFSPVNSARFASASRDGTVMIWNVTAGQPVGIPFSGAGDWVTSVAFSPDGDLLASAGWDRYVTLWDMRLESWQRSACAIANRNLTPDEWARFMQGLAYHITCPDAVVP